MKKLLFKNPILSILVFLYTVFFVLQELFPVSFGITLFKGAYYSSNEIVETVSPSKIIVNNEKSTISINSGTNITLPIEVLGEGLYNKNLIFYCSNSDVADVFYAGTESFYVVGKKQGSCSVSFSSAVNHEITSKIDINVEDSSYIGKASTYNYYQTINGKISYNTSFSVDASDSLKIGFISKTPNNIFTTNITTFEYNSEHLNIDEFGNVSFKKDSYGKNVEVNLVSDNNASISFNIKVKMPNSYGTSLSKQMFLIFVVYVLLFSVLSLLYALFLNHFAKRPFIVSLFLAFISAVILLFQFFMLNRQFPAFYFIVTPSISFVLSFVVFYKKTIKIVLERFLKKCH